MTEKNVTAKEPTEEARISPRTGKPIQAKYAPKKRRKPGGGAKWTQAMKNLELSDGENTEYLSLQIKLFTMPRIDLNDVEAVQKRLVEYFKLYAGTNKRPTVAGMAMALGISRQMLSATVRGKPTGSTGYPASLPQNVTDLIKMAYQGLENMWESYMLENKINALTGMFFGKNHYDYQDKAEYVLTPNPQDDSDYSAEDIKSRYIPPAPQKQLSEKTASDCDSE